MANRKADIPVRFEQGFLDQMDGRSNLAKNLRNRYAEVCNDLGGVDALSYMQRSLIERSLWLETWLARQEQEMAAGAEFDVSRWVQACNSLQGVYSRLGLERRTKDVPSLGEYLRTRQSSEAA